MSSSQKQHRSMLLGRINRGFTIHSSQFTIHNSQFTIHNSKFIILSLLLLSFVRVAAHEEADSLSAKDSIHVSENLSSIEGIISRLHGYDYHRYPYYSYTKYESRDLTLNDIDPLNVQQKFMKKHRLIRNFIEKNDLDKKFSVPLMTDERVEENYWRSTPKREVAVVTGIRRDGLNNAFDTGDILQVLIGEKYSDVNIFANTIRLDYHTMYSPVGRDALSHYDYELMSSSATDSSRVYHYYYHAKNGDKSAFSGDVIFVVDSVPRVKFIRLMFPHKRKNNALNSLYIAQEYGRSPQSDWVMMRNDVMAELRPWGRWGRLCYVKTQRFSDFSTDSIDDELLRGRASMRYDPKAEYRDTHFWAHYVNDIPLDSLRTDSVNRALIAQNPYAVTGTKVRINEILGYVGRIPALRIPMWITRAYVNNYIETGNPSKFVIAPTRALISFNDIDGLRLRFGGSTTARFHRRFFVDTYAAYGIKSHRFHYLGRVTYSFNDKKYQANEYPRRNIIFESRRDICVIGERSAKGDHDDIFRSLRWSSDHNSMYYNQQRILFERDEKFGLTYRVGMSFESDKSAYKHNFGKMRTSEAQFEVEYNPSRGYYYLASTQIPVNSEAPSIGVAHKWGIEGLFGGEHTYHLTEVKAGKRWFLGSWGIGKTNLKMGAVWSRVPYPLLLSPAANLSYVISDENFSLIGTSEFVNDRYTQLMLSWETNGNFVGSIPVLKRARLKEYFGLRMLWGYLTKKNVAALEASPWKGEDYKLMDESRPYIEGVIGLHNIFNIVNVEYVHRFTYRNIPNSRHSGVRFSLRFVF